MKHYIYEVHQTHKEVVGVDGVIQRAGKNTETMVQTPVLGNV